MKISEAGLRLIKSFEGFRSHPYRDAVGVWTVGYGETKGVGPTGPILNEPAAAKLLEQRINNDYAPAVRNLGLVLNQHEFDALCSVVYNLGPGVLARGRSLGDALRSGTRRQAADAILLYDKAGSPPRALPGLTRRRQQERALFLKPVGPDPAQLKKWKRQLSATQSRIAKLRARARKLRRKIGGK
jgi:lysozyme